MPDRADTTAYYLARLLRLDHVTCNPNECGLSPVPMIARVLREYEAAQLAEMLGEPYSYADIEGPSR